MRRVMSAISAAALAAAVAITGIAPASSAPVFMNPQQTAPSPVTLAQFGSTDNPNLRAIYGDSPLWREQRRTYRGDGQWRGNRQWRGDRAVGRYENRPGWYRGHRGHRQWRQGYRYHEGWWFPAGAFIAGAIIAGAANSAPAYNRGSASAHVRWCYNRYKSYREWDNTFQPYNGPRRVCYSPYNR